MKKTFFLHRLSKSFYLIFGLSLLFTFISCENFMDNADVVKEIKDSIAYANAPSCNVLLKSDESMGTFIAGDSKEFKIGYDTEIYFSANIQNGLLDNLIAQSATDANKDMSEYLTINILERDDEKGFYKINVKILKQAPDIIIKPVCIPFPAVESYSPKSDSNPSYANMGITVNFNMPMENESISKAQSQFNYRNIFITHESTDITEYFEDPEFNKEKTILALTPKNTFKDYIQSTNEPSITIQVEFSDSITVKNESRSLVLKSDDKSCFTVKYSSEVENKPPVAAGFGFFASNKKYTVDELKTKSDKTGLEAFSYDDIAEKGNTDLDVYSAKVKKNSTSGSLYIYGRYYDTDSGVNRISITSKHTHHKDGTPFLDDDTNTTDFYVNDEYTDTVFDIQNQTVIFCIKYDIPETFTDPEENDGAFDLTVRVYDACGNYTENQTFTVIKDFYINTDNIFFWNISNDFNNHSRQHSAVVEQFNNNTYNENLKILKFDFAKTVYSVVESFDSVQIFVKYINKTGTEVTEEINADSTNKRFYSHKLNVDHVYDLKATVIIKDNYGNETTKDLYYPPRAEKVAGREFLILPAGVPCTYAYLNIAFDNGTIATGASGSYNNTLTKWFLPNPNEKYTICFENGFLFSEISDDVFYAKYGMFNNVVKVDNNNPVDVTPVIKDYKFFVEGEEYKLTVSLEDDIWEKNPDKWDYIIVGVANDLYPYNKDLFDNIVMIPLFFSKGVTSLTTNVYVPNYNGRYMITVGIKGNARSAASEYKLLTVDSDYLAEMDLEVNNNKKPSLDDSILPMEYEDSANIGWNIICDYYTIYGYTTNADTLQATINNTYRDVYNLNDFGPGKGTTVFDIDKTKSYLKLPVMDWKYGDNTIELKVTNKNGSATRKYNVTLLKSPLKFNFDLDEEETLPLTNITFKSDPTTWDRETMGYQNGKDDHAHIYVAYLDYKGWHNLGKYGHQTWSGDPNNGEFEETSEANGKFTYTFTANGIPDNTYIKVSNTLNLGESASYDLFFNGQPSSGEGVDDIIEDNGRIYITSDMPVYVNTVTTKCTYAECSKWTAAQWEELHYKFNDKYIKFSESNAGTLYPYILDLRPIQDGDCYVIIAHYADGHTKMSEVKVK